MTIHRRLRHVAAILALFSVLFSQLAIAAYACPGVAAMAEVTSPAMPDMPDCDQSMPAGERSALCQAHCMQGDQSLDKPAPSLQGLALASAHPVAFGLHAVEAAACDLARTGLLAERPPEPPAALRHCRLHI